MITYLIVEHERRVDILLVTWAGGPGSCHELPVGVGGLLFHVVVRDPPTVIVLRLVSFA